METVWGSENRLSHILRRKNGRDYIHKVKKNKASKCSPTLKI
jgi:hypothetical protein